MAYTANRIINRVPIEQLPPTDTDQLQARIDALEAENAYLRHQLKLADDAVRQAVASLGAAL